MKLSEEEYATIFWAEVLQVSESFKDDQNWLVVLADRIKAVLSFDFYRWEL